MKPYLKASHHRLLELIIELRRRWKKYLEAGVHNWIPIAPLTSILLVFGVISENIITIVFEAALLSTIVSLFFTSHVKSEHIVKRIFEVIFLFSAFTVIGYGYVITRSIIFKVVLLSIVTIFIIAFTLSYICPKIYSKYKTIRKVGNIEVKLRLR